MMNIRPFLASDEEACAAIFNSIDDDFFAQLKEDDFRRWILRSLNTDNHYYFVVETDDGIVGCGGFLIKGKEKEAVIAWGMVHPKYQGQGYGIALLDFRIAEIKKKLPTGKIITLDTTQQTFEFFEKKGFVVTKIQEGYHKKDLHRYDMELVY